MREPLFRAPPTLRTFCLIAVAAMTAQLFFVAEPQIAGRIVQVAGRVMQVAPDKLFHIAYFGAMAFLLWVATSGRWPLALWLTVVLIGGLDEAHQAARPGRIPDFQDWLADGFGAAAALFVLQRKSPASGFAVYARALTRTGA